MTKTEPRREPRGESAKMQKQKNRNINEKKLNGKWKTEEYTKFKARHLRNQKHIASYYCKRLYFTHFIVHYRYSVCSYIFMQCILNNGKELENK